LHRKQNSYRWKTCRFYCRLVRLMNSIFRLSLMISYVSYETWFWWVSAATWASLSRWSYHAEWTDSSLDRWFQEELQIEIQWTQRSARLLQVELVVIHEKRCLCSSLNDSAKSSENLSRSRETCWFRCRSDRVLRSVNCWWTISLSIMSKHQCFPSLTSKICFKINELIHRFFYLIYNWLSWCQ